MEQDFDQRVVELGRKLHAEGFPVTLDYCVQVAAIARLMRRSEKRIRNLRCDLQGPPSDWIGKRPRGGVWYRLDDYLRWSDSRSKKKRDSVPLTSGQDDQQTRPRALQPGGRRP